jgi:cellulose synthase/poly-beta-1,6-N-acetylglucosamine synthase-like glycosyltransferase
MASAWIFLSNLYSDFVLVYFFVIDFIYLALLLIALRAILHYLRKNRFVNYERILQSEFATPISILAPAYNEEKTITESVQSLMMLNYAKYEVVVVNDGSKDSTLQRLIDSFKLKKITPVFDTLIQTEPVYGVYRSPLPAYKRLLVVDKKNGGKADALNAGINAAKYPLVCCIDADSLLEQDALLKVVKPFLEYPERMVAAGGIVRIVNGCKVDRGHVIEIGLSRKWIPTFQVVEYLRAFLSGRMGWTAINGLLVISGAFGLFKRKALIEVGGYNRNTVGEDMELIVRLHKFMRKKKRKYRIDFVPDPVCWTEAPETLKILARQRNRWHRGLIDTLRMHKEMFFNPRYGVAGMLSFPYFVLFELIGPIVEATGVIFVAISFLFGAVNLEFFLIFLALAIVYGIFLSVGAVLLEEYSFHRYPKPSDLLRLILFGVMENFGYRQMTAWWRIKATFDYFRGVRSWGAMTRVGFEKGRAPTV